MGVTRIVKMTICYCILLSTIVRSVLSVVDRKKTRALHAGANARLWSA